MNKNVKPFNATLHFGSASMGKGILYFYTLINNSIIDLVRSLPDSVQIPAMLFFMRYAGIEAGEPLDFFRNYYLPIWSSIPHVIAKANIIKIHNKSISHAAKAHAMIMLLHSLDDHINDGQIAPDHLTILIRSQAWKIFCETISELCSLMHDDSDIVNTLIDNYYASIFPPKAPKDIEEYLNLFKMQMSTGLIVPLLIARFVGGTNLEQRVRALIESFGVAWRILDDIQDMEYDLDRGCTSAVTLSFFKEGMSMLSETIDVENTNINGKTVMSLNNKQIQLLRSSKYYDDIISKLKDRMITELNTSIQLANDVGLNGLSKELRELRIPLI